MRKIAPTRWEKRIYRIVEKHEKGDWTSFVFDYVIIALVLLSVIAIILESFRDLDAAYQEEFYAFEIFTIVVFSIEYLLRLLAAPARYNYDTRWACYLKHITSPLAIIDLLAIAPFFLPMMSIGDLRFLRLLRVLRIIRILKLKRYSLSLDMVLAVFKEKKNELLTTILISQIVLLIAATLMYYIEGDENPSFPNIIETLWWAVVTMTTVGYGDVVPVTGMGKILNGIIALIGIGVVALPTSILSAGFLEKIQKDKRVRDQHANPDVYAYDYCPHCGKKLPHDA
jgi:voltage-gated potassium channel